jgi:hypothetical protein
MSERFWTIDEANRALPRLGDLVGRARRALQAQQDRATARRERAGSNGHGRAGSNGQGRAGERTHDSDEELAAIARELDEDGIILRDVEQGLVDFPARSPSGHEYWLCWLVGEPAVEWWHWPQDGFAGRTSIDDLPE